MSWSFILQFNYNQSYPPQIQSFQSENSKLIQNLSIVINHKICWYGHKYPDLSLSMKCKPPSSTKFIPSNPTSIQTIIMNTFVLMSSHVSLKILLWWWWWSLVDQDQYDPFEYNDNDDGVLSKLNRSSKSSPINILVYAIRICGWENTCFLSSYVSIPLLIWNCTTRIN